MNNEVRITANAKIITSNVQKIADLHNLVTDIHTQADNSVILREVDDRLARRNNALFLGIVESQKSTPIERQEDDLSRVQGICYTLANNVSISSCTRLDHNRIDKSKESQGLSPVSGESFDSPRQNKSPEERTKDITSTTPGTDSSRGTEFEDCNSCWSTEDNQGPSEYFSLDSQKLSFLNSTSSCLTLYYQNVRGLNTKLDSIFYKTSMAEYDFYAFSETWLKTGVFNNEIFSNEYSVFRCDRR
ncbi:uncharacterized protein LOC123263957 [Cotesia glomerata]|uniref:uncharacterized protein LOC123263957 n=1 Tax=Cotesia glomerata TaxID=32391 RepID=UPI001D019176|nr:uncharacterized protein LOC123263957 [Cotesia glomerata]